jgi:tetratricopeptide (TPR) repeat protein
LPFFGLAAAASVVTYVVQKQTGALVAGEKLPLGARSGNALISYCRYLGKLFWPVDLAVFYPRPGHWPLEQVLLAGGLIMGVTVLLIVKRRRYPFMLMGWLWYCGTLVPVIGLVQVGEQAMADRYTYIPSLGVLILAIWGVYELTRSWRYQVMVLSVLGCAVVILCLGMARQQLGYWKNSETLFRHALEVTENNHLAHNNLGFTLDKKGQTGEAISQYQEAIRLKPDFAEAHFNLGTALGKKSLTDEAISQYQEAIRLKPDFAEAHYNLGAALVVKNQIDEAISQFREAIRLKPDFAEAHINLGAALVGKNQIDEAISQYQEAIRLKPDFAEAHNNLGSALGKKGQIDEAINQFQEAIRLKPDFAAARSNLAHALEMKNAPAGR